MIASFGRRDDKGGSSVSSQPKQYGGGHSTKPVGHADGAYEQQQHNSNLLQKGNKDSYFN